MDSDERTDLRRHMVISKCIFLAQLRVQMAAIVRVPLLNNLDRIYCLHICDEACTLKQLQMSSDRRCGNHNRAVMNKISHTRPHIPSTFSLPSYRCFAAAQRSRLINQILHCPGMSRIFML